MSNLPPGVEPHMIPGNRPEDAMEEAFRDGLAHLLDTYGLDLSRQSDKVLETFDMHADGLFDLIVRYRSHPLDTDPEQE